MENKNSVLLYHVYLMNNWESITIKLLKNVPHDDIYVNINIDLINVWKVLHAMNWLKRHKKVKKVFFTINSKTEGEVLGFKKLCSAIQNKNYSLLTYMHGKGVTKPNNKNIQDWVELMRYFLIERMDLCLEAFTKGYKLYGINMGQYKEGEEKYGPYRFSSFHFSGNFVTVNLKLLNNEFFSTPVDKDYFGVESFWGKLCSVNDVCCPHISGENIKNHYLEPYPVNLYKKYNEETV